MPNRPRFSSRTLSNSISLLMILLVLGISILVPPSSALTNNGSITTLGAPLTENFDTLASTGTGIVWTDNTTIPGWYSSRTTYNTGTGSSNTGALYSFGVLGVNPASDRALGSVGSGGTGTVYWGAKLVNNTGSTITSIDLSYFGEQWRNGGATAPAVSVAQTADFQYQVANAGTITAINTPSSGWVDDDSLDFTSPTFGTSAPATLDGNAAANRVAKAATLSVTINNGQEIWIRWRDVDHAGNDHGLAIDDLSVTAAGGDPTPSPTPTPDPNVGTVVISQVYGGGGNTGSTLKNDYIELINHSSAPVDLSGWSVQHLPTSGSTWSVTPLTNFILQPGQYYLIQESQGAGGTEDLPTPDAVGTITVSSTSGKVALVSNTTALVASCPSGSGIVDFVGYGNTSGNTANCFEGSGPVPTLSNTTAALRKDDGCFDTDDNAKDFVEGGTNPRNSSSPFNDCTGLAGFGSANPSTVLQGEMTTLTVYVAPAQNPPSTGVTVTADLSQIGGSSAQVFSGGPNTFTFVATIPANNPTGMKSLPVTISDAESRTASTSIVLSVLPLIPDHVTISQLYGGGGNASATFNHDYVELYNPHTSAFDLTGWSLQYSSATGDTWAVQPLGGTIAPGEYYLIGLATNNSAIGDPLPPANIDGDINMSATTGKIALVNNFDALEGTCPIGNPGIVDFLGYGGSASCAETTRAAAPSNTTALFRKNDGARDSDNNLNDFVTSAPNPRRTAPIVEIGPSVFSTNPRNNATTAPRDATITINFTEPVTVDDGWYNINCVSTGNHNSATVRSFFGGDTHTITPNVNFLAGEQCTVTIFRDAIHDVDTDDPAPNGDSLPADKTFTFTVATGTAPPYPSSVHLTMGNPNGATADLGQPDNYLMEKPEFSLSYNRTRGTSNWVSWHLSDEWVGTLARVDTFRADPAVPADWFRVSEFDYVGSGFDRGHMVPNADRDKETSIPINQATFLMTNMIPQSPDNNQGPWARLEDYLRTQLAGNEIYIVAGGAGTGGVGSNAPTTTTSSIAGGNVTVPAQTWKVALILPKNSGDDVARVNCSTRTLAVIMPNIQGIRNVNWETYIKTVDEVETLTGYDFFSNLPDAVENCVEAGNNGTNPPATANQSASTSEDTPVEITLQAARPDFDPLTFSIVSEPTNGELGSIGTPSCTDFACSATVTYTPGSNYNGPDSFTFKVNDGTQDSNTSTVSITVNSVNDDPDAVDDEATVVEDSGANTINVRANDSDVEDDTLTVTAVTQGTNGSVAITNSGADVSYTPNADFFGTDSFTYTVSDGNGGDDTATVSITVTNVNDAPVLTSSVAMSSISSTNSNLFNVGLTASATDQEGEVVTIQVAVFGDEDDETATLPGVVHSPDAKDIAPNTLRLRGERVEANDGRVYLIIVTATDTSGGVSRNYHTVVVPKNNKKANITAVNAEAAAAAAFAESSGGTPPPGYFIIGDGPIIGPKQ